MDAPLQAALVDAHVHFHSCFETTAFLSAARENFRRAADELGIDSAFDSYLLLTESADANWFAHLESRASSGGIVTADWLVQPTDDPSELALRSRDGTVLHVVAGRQIVTAERLEVLALGTKTIVPDGYPIVETLRRVGDLGAITVIPWGFGKWLGGRGAKVREIIEAAIPGQLFLGDNSGRLAGGREPPLFQTARAKGIAMLPGTDPFPFDRQTERVGRMGCAVYSAQELARWRQLRAAILSSATIRPYGELERPLPFAFNQVAMQLRMRMARRRRPQF